MFQEKYIRSLRSSDLRDDHYHCATEALFAAAIASKTGAGLGALLSRVKYADGTPREAFGPGSHNVARLLAIWHAMVTEKGKSRGWIKIRSEGDITAAHALYRKVAAVSLAYWIDSRCLECQGTGLTSTRRHCPVCHGMKKAELRAGHFERQRTLDMVSELEGLLQAHNRRAAMYVRRNSKPK